MSEIEVLFHRAWLGMVQPAEGLLVSVAVLVDAECMQKQPPELQEELLELCVRAPAAKGAGATAEAPRLRIRDLASLFKELLGLTPDLFDVADAVPEELALYVPEGGQTIRPTMALRSQEGPGHVALVWQLPDGLPLDKPETATGSWEYPPSAKLDRLLRRTRVPIGILSNAEEIRLVYAPAGESSGSITFRLAAMSTVGGRPILDAMVMLLSASRFFGVAKERQLPAILAQSRERQANVTSELANQVFEGLEALLQGFESAAERDRTSQLREAIERGDDHVYAGLLTVLLRLVFVLYAEDRGLLPTNHELYARELSVLALYEELVRDQGAYPDAMTRRFGAWGRLVALFRAIYLGVSHGDLQMPAKRGELFDPNTYPFLEGWGPAGSAPVRHAESRAAVELPSVDDGTILTVLEKLIMFEGQRLSYRALDVEQIGSVYEALMGYHVLRVVSRSVCMRPNRVWLSAEEVRVQKTAQRAAWLKETTGLSTAQATKLAEATGAAKTDDAITTALEAFAAKGTALASEGRLVLQPGIERRRTSSHYTPRSLSAPIVRKALAPLFVCLDADGKGAKSKDILSLSVCDPAMGSGAFLVEACRMLADEVVAAWTREGDLPTIAAAHSDVIIYARRLVAQSCLYGVDKNPYAVSLAKLSLWLLTLAKDESFSFVDHALRHGDSLVGLDFDQIRSFHWKPGKQLDLCAKELEGVLDESVSARQKIQALANDTSPNAQREKERLLYDAEDALDRARLLGDLIVGAFFVAEKDKAREAERVRRFDLVKSWLTAGGPVPEQLREMQREIRSRVPVFHWMIEFPEIFYVERPDPLDGGRVNRAAFMDAFVGNPPFLGGTRISVANGVSYRDWLAALFGASSLTDLCAFFFRRAAALLGAKGCAGLVATNSISQGDSRTTGLGWICTHGGAIYDASRDLIWPGDAAVVVSTVHFSFGLAHSVLRLDGREVRQISSFLASRGRETPPQALRANHEIAVIGSFILGIGFVFEDGNPGATSIAAMNVLLANKKNREVIKKYIGGEDLNSNATHTSSRFIIDFGDRTADQAKSGWPELFDIVENRVKPARANVQQRDRREEWWRHATRSPVRRKHFESHDRALAISQVTSNMAFAFIGRDVVLSHTSVAILLDQDTAFAVLQSRVHEPWARLLGSSMKTDLRYAPSACFDTFPFPRKDPRAVLPELEDIGRSVYEARSAYMLEFGRGMTQTYNALKDASMTDERIATLRELHEDLDRAVLAAYGWSDIPVPPYVSAETDEAKTRLASFEDKIIDRLFLLNAARAEEEAKAGPAAARKRPKAAVGKGPGGAKGSKAQAAGGRCRARRSGPRMSPRN